MDSYTEAHLFVAAIRLLRHQKKAPPAIEDICPQLGISTEAGLTIARRLAAKGIIELSEDPFTLKASVGDHLKIEELPRSEEDSQALARELEQFMSKKQDFDRKVEAIKSGLEEKRKKMHHSIEEKLRQELKKMKGGS